MLLDDGCEFIPASEGGSYLAMSINRGLDLYLRGYYNPFVLFLISYHLFG